MGHKKQHFVPRCYLKAWHDPDAPPGGRVTPYVWQFDKDGGNPRRKAPANLFTETDIYTIPLADGGRDLRLEHGFSELEDKFTRIRNTRFLRGEWPDDTQLMWVRTFVAATQVRTAGMRDHLRRQWAQLREIGESLEREMRQAAPEKRAAIARTGQVISKDTGGRLSIDDVRTLESMPLQHMVEPVLRAVVPGLANMHMAVLRTADPTGFLTTDQPCTWFDPEAYKRQPIYRGPGLAMPTIEVTLPISPRQCLFISHNANMTGYLDIDERALNGLNRRHIAHCNSHFIACRNEIRPAWFEHLPMPDDAWEAVRARKIASGEFDG